MLPVLLMYNNSRIDLAHNYIHLSTITLSWILRVFLLDIRINDSMWLYNYDF